MPDLDNRAPSLLRWVAGQVEAGIVAALDEVKGLGQQVLGEAAHLSYMAIAGNPRLACWERAWKLAGHQGFGRWVALDVAEGEDEVMVRVDGRVVARLLPPWIAARRSGETVTDEEDAAARAQFDDSILDIIRTELAPSTAVGRCDRRRADRLGDSSGTSHSTRGTPATTVGKSMGEFVRYTLDVRKTTLNVDDELIDRASSVLGTRGLKATVDGALHEVIAADARRRFAQRLRTMEGLDLDRPEVMSGAWR